jgi:hypothetical protein
VLAEVHGTLSVRFFWMIVLVGHSLCPGSNDNGRL